MVDTRQNLLDVIEQEKERRLWELGQYSTSELLDEIQRRREKEDDEQAMRDYQEDKAKEYTQSMYENKDVIDYELEDGKVIAFNSENERERVEL
jgi:hypothetical protein